MKIKRRYGMLALAFPSGASMERADEHPYTAITVECRVVEGGDWAIHTRTLRPCLFRRKRIRRMAGK